MAKRRAKEAEAPEVDIDDEDSVRAEMSAALDIAADELSIKSDSNYESFGAATVWRVEIKRRGGPTGKEWYVVADFQAAYDLAVEMVKQDLETEPEIFNQDFIERHIDEKKLRDELHADVLASTEERLTEQDAEEFWSQAEAFGGDMYIPEEDEDGDRRNPTREEIDELAEVMTKDTLNEPMAYLEEIYGKEDAVKEAIRIAGIDIDAAADDAIDTDGPGNYLSSYDGETHDTPGGFVYWRHN